MTAPAGQDNAVLGVVTPVHKETTGVTTLEIWHAGQYNLVGWSGRMLALALPGIPNSPHQSSGEVLGHSVHTITMKKLATVLSEQEGKCYNCRI